MEYTEKELQQERWKPIFGYDGMYEVSDLGRVRSHKSGEWKLMMARDNSNGYLSVMLYKYGNGKNYYIHQLVARYFVPNDNLFNTEINHIDECKQNNRVSNIEWCDRQYNMTYNDLHLCNAKYPKIKDIFRSDLTIDENIRQLYEQGIDVSRDTILRVRKELGLKGSRPQYVLNKVRDLYDQNLNYEDNLKVFKQNGVECSRGTIQNIRKELGLTKKYNRNQ